VRWARTASAALALLFVAAAGCSSKPPPTTYKAGVVPGISVSRLEELVGKPQSTIAFSLPTGVSAQILAYPFGQTVVRGGQVRTVTIAGDPSYVGPHGVRLNMPEDQVLKALHGTRANGHRDSYDVIVGDTVTRTKDYYDERGHVMYEFAAANANDPEAPYNLVSINLADADGFNFLEDVAKSKQSGEYTGQHIDNYISEPWTV
jgi:hypothetical protein